jgi:uncharacterized protein (DUF2164 family)
LPSIDLSALSDKLGGLARDPHFKRLLTALLALLLAGGAVLLGPSIKRKLEGIPADNEETTNVDEHPDAEGSDGPGEYARVYQEIADQLQALLAEAASGQKPPAEAISAIRQKIETAQAQVEPGTPEAQHLAEYLKMINAYDDGRTQAADPDKTNGAKTEALTTAQENIKAIAATIENDGITTPEEAKKVTRPLAELTTNDLTELQKKIEAEEQQAKEAERQRRAEQNAAAEATAANEIEWLFADGLYGDFDKYIKRLDNHEAFYESGEKGSYIEKLRTWLTSILDTLDANKSEEFYNDRLDQYFTQQGIRTNVARLQELKLLEDCAIYLIPNIGELKWNNSEQNILTRLRREL